MYPHSYESQIVFILLLLLLILIPGLVSHPGGCSHEIGSRSTVTLYWVSISEKGMDGLQ